MKNVLFGLCAFSALCNPVPIAEAAVTAYTDETEFLNALTTLGYTPLHEGFEDDSVWGSVRSPQTAASIANLGVTWTANNVNSEVTTGQGPALGGSWGFFTLPHGDFGNGIGDGRFHFRP